jgi:putative SOS response-associated peptidase YedK
MCGRFAVTTDPARLAQEIDARDETGGAGAVPNYNVAPTTDIAAVVARHGIGTGATRRVRLMRWGLLPSWVKADADGRPLASPKNGGRLLINARADKITLSPAFRAAAEHKRCLVPMDGYYEWMPGADTKGRKTPYYIYRQDGRPLLVAGLWSAWRPAPAGRSGATRESEEAADPKLTCTIITTDAVDELGRVHDRMPLVVAEADWDRWLDPDRSAPTDLLAAPPDITGITMRQVSTLVNNVANNGPELIAPAEPDYGGDQPVGLF